MDKKGLFPYSIRIVFPNIWVWMKEFNIFDLRFGFYVKNYLHGKFPRSKIDHPGQDMRILISYNILGSKTKVFAFFPEVLEGLGRSGRLVGTVSTCKGIDRVVNEGPHVRFHTFGDRP